MISCIPYVLELYKIPHRHKFHKSDIAKVKGHMSCSSKDLCTEFGGPVVSLQDMRETFLFPYLKFFNTSRFRDLFSSIRQGYGDILCGGVTQLAKTVSSHYPRKR